MPYARNTGPTTTLSGILDSIEDLVASADNSPYAFNTGGTTLDGIRMAFTDLVTGEDNSANYPRNTGANTTYSAILDALTDLVKGEDNSPYPHNTGDTTLTGVLLVLQDAVTAEDNSPYPRNTAGSTWTGILDGLIDALAAGALGGARIVLSSSTIPEDASVNDVIGILSVTNGSGVYVFTVTADPDSKFKIANDDELQVENTLDYETATSHSVTVEADNGVDAPVSRQFTISVTDVVDETGPIISSITITSSPAVGDTYGAGEDIEATITWNEAAPVTGTPQLTINVGGSNKIAAYASGTGSTTLVFSYTVQGGDVDANGISIAANSLALNGGTIKDAAGNNATLTHSAVTDQSGHKVDADDAPNAPTSLVWVSPPNVNSSIAFTFTHAGSVVGDIALLQIDDTDNTFASIEDTGGLEYDGVAWVPLGTPNPVGPLTDGPKWARLIIQRTGVSDSAASNIVTQTIDATAPTILSSTPADNATGVAINTNISIKFSETIAFGANVDISTKTVGGATIEAFTEADIGTKLTLTTTTLTDDTLVINGADFSEGVAVAVQISAVSIEDDVGNAFAGIANDTTLNFTTTAGVAGRNFDATNDKVTISPATLLDVYPVTLDTGKRHSHPVPFELANGDLLVGWTDNITGAQFTWNCASSSDGGATLGTRVVIGGDGTTGPTLDGTFAQLSGGNVFCAYCFNSNIKYRVSTDNGATWGSEQTITDGVHAQGRPTCVLNGTTLTVAYVDSTGQIQHKQSTVTSSAIGAFGSEVLVVGGSNSDPSIALLPNGELGVSYQFGTLAKFIASTDSGAGATWGTAVTVSTHDTETADAANPVLLVNGAMVWCSFSAGANQSGTYPTVTAGTRVLFVTPSDDNGATWGPLYPTSMISTDDVHRAAWCLLAGHPICFAAAISGDTDYHISRLSVSTDFVANVQAQGPSMTNLQTWTGWAWLRVSGAINAADNSYALSKSVADRIPIQMKAGATAALREIHAFVNRATTASDYQVVNQVADNTWTFVATTFDDTRGNGARFEIFVGTTTGNLASITPTVVAEGSGAINDDTRAPLIIGSRNSDDLRVWPGDLGKVGYAEGVLTLTQLQGIMNNTLPAATVGRWSLLATESAIAADTSLKGNQGIITGTTASSSGTPL